MEPKNYKITLPLGSNALPPPLGSMTYGQALNWVSVQPPACNWLYSIEGIEKKKLLLKTKMSDLKTPTFSGNANI